MSTLTSPASPAASPRLDYTPYRPPSRPTRSPSNHSTNLTSSPKFPSKRSSAGSFVHHPAAKASPRAYQAKPQTADVGTQYSPEGLPPTARIVGAAPAAAGSSNKRKQPSPSPPMTSALVETSRTSTPLPESQDAPANAEAKEVVAEVGEAVAVAPPQKAATTTLIVPPKKARVDREGKKVMPRQYETCDPKDLGVLIADMLMELIRLNDKIPLKDGKLTRFHSRAPPGISTHDYLNRLIQHATLSPPILLSMVYYIDRLCALYPAFTVGSLTVHRFLITAATVASKGLSDSFWTNPTYARIGGISTSELATLELDFLQRVHFRIVPKPETLVDYYVSLVQRSDAYCLEDENPSLEPAEAPDDRMQENPD